MKNKRIRPDTVFRTDWTHLFFYRGLEEPGFLTLNWGFFSAGATAKHTTDTFPSRQLTPRMLQRLHTHTKEAALQPNKQRNTDWEEGVQKGCFFFSADKGKRRK